MLVKYYVRNFKSIGTNSFRSFSHDMELQPFSVLIGPNGSGKSSLLQSIDFLRAFFYDSVSAYLQEKSWDYADLPNLRQTQKKIEWRAVFSIPPNDEGLYGGTYRLDISLLKRKFLNIGTEMLSYREDAEPISSSSARSDWISIIQRSGRDTILFSPSTQHRESARFFDLPASVATYIGRSEKEAQNYPEVVHFMEYVRGIRFASIFDVENLREPLRGYATEIGPKGENLLPYLARMAHTNPDLYDKIKTEVCRIFSNVSDLGIRGYSRQGDLKILEVKENRTTFNGKQVSDGLLRILAILAIRHSDKPPSILLFEEPENGVHPRLLERMIHIFSGMTKRKGQLMTQVITTTHSPYLVDHLRDDPKSIILAKRRSIAGSSEFQRLDNLFPDGIPEGPLGELWYNNLLGDS